MVLSHLATAWRNEENPHNNITELQQNRFLEMKKKFETYEYNHILYSLTNTDGSRLGKEYFFDIPRAGRGVHGLSIYADKFSIKQAFHVVGQVMQVKIVKKGENIGYGASQTLEKDTTLGVINVGKYTLLPINFKFLDKIKYKGKEYPVKFVFLAYSMVDFGDDIPEYLDEVEFMFSTRFLLND